jgi:hypothetical protein
MPPREFHTPREKREELKTYRELALGRQLKSIRHRRRLQASGAQRVLGDGSDTQPYLAVDARSYREVRMEVQRRLLLEAREKGLNLPLDLLLEQLRPRIESLAYAELARAADDAAAHRLPTAALGRARGAVRAGAPPSFAYRARSRPRSGGAATGA